MANHSKFKKFKTQPRDINPKVYDELAAKGFNSALRLLAFKRNETPAEALKFLSKELQRDVVQLEAYRKAGLPDHLVHKTLEILEENNVMFGTHQLRPNVPMVQQADLDARNTSANGTSRSK